MKRHFLLIDDNRFYLKAMKKKIELTFPHIECTTADTAHKAMEAYARGRYELIVCDLILPDSDDGSLIRRFVDEGQKVVVITDFADAMIRQRLVSYNIVDYIIKSDSDNFDYLLTLIDRLEKNKQRTVLIVYADEGQSGDLAEHLQRQNLNVVKAGGGEEAMACLAHQRIDLVITDHKIKDMTGLDLVRALRGRMTMQELPIITLTGSDSASLIARYLKSGANDFLKKPFSGEELMCRVAMLLSMKEIFDQIRSIAVSDQLTGLYNRFYLYEAGGQMLTLAKRSEKPLSVAMIDIDHFKLINDTYGHLVGDRVLVRVAAVLRKTLRKSDLIVRYGGEEFVVIMPETSCVNAAHACEKIREAVSRITVQSSHKRFGLTVSIGIDTFREGDDMDAVIGRADALLYRAKENGRDRVERCES